MSAFAGLPLLTLHNPAKLVVFGGKTHTGRAFIPCVLALRNAKCLKTLKFWFTRVLQGVLPHGGSGGVMLVWFFGFDYRP